MPDKLPPHIRAQIEDFKRKATHNEALSKEYRDQYSRVHTPNQPTYEQWLKDNGKQRMAKGGDVSLKEMHDYIANQGGVYEGRRFERASDEVPNLMKMYKADALKGLFTGDNARGLMTMNPADFEKYAMPISEDAASNRGYRKNWHDTDVLNHEQYIKHLARLRGFESVPYLDVDKRMSGVRENPFIAGHEGRHRSRALAHKGVEKSLVQFIPRAELREGFPRREREPYIDAIRHELSLTGNRVNPEKEKEFKYDTNKPTPRSSIILPDVYAEGGKVSLFRKHGLPTSSIEDAQRKLGEGHLVFVAHEQDESPREVRSVSEFHGYVPDQIYTVHPKHFMQKKADGGDVQENGPHLYSALDQALQNVNRKKGTLQEFGNEFVNLPNVKQTELNDRRLNDMLSRKYVTLNGAPSQINKERFAEMVKKQKPVLPQSHMVRKPHYSTLTVPNGQNYREELFKFPVGENEKPFISSHWDEEEHPNVMAHARLSDRTLPDNRRLLHIEELQSDMHQAGRKHGYHDESDIQKAKNIANRIHQNSKLMDKELLNKSMGTPSMSDEQWVRIKKSSTRIASRT